MQWTDKIQVYNEDCMQTMSRYEDNYFDLAIVDPPYGDGEKIFGFKINLKVKKRVHENKSTR
jgi:DNA modification methylase